MATKYTALQCKALGFPDDLIARAQSAGVPFNILFQLFMQFGGQALELVQKIIDAWRNPTPPAVLQAKKKGAAKGCCDHHCCCTETLTCAIATVDAAAAHLAACCAENCDTPAE